MKNQQSSLIRNFQLNLNFKENYILIKIKLPFLREGFGMGMTDTEIIWNTYSEDVKRFILSKIKDESIADDLLQEIFIKVHTKIQNVKDVNKMKSWIFSVANNTILKTLILKLPIYTNILNKTVYTEL